MLPGGDIYLLCIFTISPTKRKNFQRAGALSPQNLEQDPVRVAKSQQMLSTKEDNQRKLLFDITFSRNRILLLSGSVPKESLHTREEKSTSRKQNPILTKNANHDQIRALSVCWPLQEILQGTTDLFLGMSALLPRRSVYSSFL